MKVLIIEDEVPAAEKLERYLNRYNPDIDVLHKIESVSESITWLTDRQNELDLIFMDIQLIDGKSFQIFDQIEIFKPVVFITAFDEFAIDAFKVNSIDYLLKPITYDDLSKALDKYDSLKKNFDQSLDMGNLNAVLSQLRKKSYKTRFMVKVGEHIKSITTDQVEYYYADGRSVYLVTSANRKFIIDYKLEELEELLDPKMFYRVNRSFIVNIDAIQDVIVYSNSRLKIIPTLDFDKEIIVSREKVGTFKGWYDGL